MPVIVVGADASLGERIIEALLPRTGEVRAFVSDPGVAASLKARGVKAALGDVSDGSHVGGAALNAYVAVLLAEAATDERERSFASDPEGVFAAWAEGLRDAGVRRIIWITSAHWDPPESIRSLAVETAVVDPSDMTPDQVAQTVARLDDAAEI